jgi:hypothetical protein
MKRLPTYRDMERRLARSEAIADWALIIFCFAATVAGVALGKWGT